MKNAATMLEDALAEGEKRGEKRGQIEEREEILKFMIKMKAERNTIISMIMERYGFNEQMAIEYYEKIANKLGVVN